ncbi:response regulator [Chitinophaga sedimenti]|uniref:response regulator n=1 Tax=Chitinophaga sedimenti TaxID=2033606 RepID=UPI0020061CE9|nr:response regulator [Chitinophaga sedimenti]MCK7558019.1 response regulator [Chitinophaga sedimenti]
MTHTILLIEDNLGISENMKSLLELHEYDVLTANNGADGATMARAHRPDLVISDIYMPACDGYELLDMFLEDEEMRDIPVIMLSGRTEMEDADLAISKGAAGYVTKPFMFKSLHAKIQAVLSERH